MRLLPQSAEVLRRLGEASETDLVAVVLRAGEVVIAEVPTCVGFSYRAIGEDLTFTVVATLAETATTRPAQEPPAEERAAGDALADPTTCGDALDERLWRLAALADWRAVGSSISLPVLDGPVVVGTVSFYASAPDAFDGHEERLAQVVGASAGTAVTNADLIFSSRDDAESAPAHLDDLVVIDRAVGIVAVSRTVGVVEARVLLHDAAERAGVADADVARSVVDGA